MDRLIDVEVRQDDDDGVRYYECTRGGASALLRVVSYPQGEDEISYQHPMTGDWCESPAQVCAGWSDGEQPLLARLLEALSASAYLAVELGAAVDDDGYLRYDDDPDGPIAVSRGSMRERAGGRER